jgi:hypothetical protein
MTGQLCNATTKVDGIPITCELPSGHWPVKPHYNAPMLHSWGAPRDRLGQGDINGRGEYHPETGLWDWYKQPAERPSGTITVKLVLDTTDFDAALERAKAALAELVGTPIKVEVQ